MNLTLVGDKLVITDAFKQRAAASALDGAQFAPMLKGWLVDATAANAASLAAMCVLPADVAALLPAAPRREVVEDSGAWLTRATPYAHQREAVAAAMGAMHDGGGFAMLLEMGCGKTLAALEVASRLAAAGEVHRVLIIAPGAVVPVWQREAAQFLSCEHSCAALLGTRPKRLEALSSLHGPLCIAVVNYESAWRLADELIAWGADLVVCDEMQRIKGHATKQTKGVTAIGHAARFRLGLSGTPVTNSPLDVFAEWRYMDRRIFGDSYYAFRSKYAVLADGYGAAGKFKQVVGFKALDDLTERAHSIAYRVTKAEALDLPDTVDTVVPVTLGPAERRAYDALARDSVAAFDAGEVSATNVLTRMLRLQQVASGRVPRDDGDVEVLGSSKMDAALEVIEDALSQGGKVVVFARFTAEVEAMLAHFGSAAAGLHGAVPDHERGEVVRRFQEDADCRVMVAQIQVGGAGITLTAASTMVFVSLTFNYAEYEQAKARIHRIGQSEKCTYVHVVAVDTVDEAIMDAMSTKRNVAALIVDRGRGIYGG